MDKLKIILLVIKTFIVRLQGTVVVLVGCCVVVVVTLVFLARFCVVNAGVDLIFRVVVPIAVGLSVHDRGVSTGVVGHA